MGLLQEFAQPHFFFILKRPFPFPGTVGSHGHETELCTLSGERPEHELGQGPISQTRPLARPSHCPQAPPPPPHSRPACRLCHGLCHTAAQKPGGSPEKKTRETHCTPIAGAGARIEGKFTWVGASGKLNSFFKTYFVVVRESMRSASYIFKCTIQYC